jgi:hypothetical protein
VSVSSTPLQRRLRLAVLGQPLLAHRTELSYVHASGHSQSGVDHDRGHGEEQDEKECHERQP